MQALRSTQEASSGTSIAVIIPGLLPHGFNGRLQPFAPRLDTVLFAAGDTHGEGLPDLGKRGPIIGIGGPFRLGLREDVPHEGEPCSNFMRVLFERSPLLVLVETLGVNRVVNLLSCRHNLPFVVCFGLD
jgi:hypothetical protein